MNRTLIILLALFMIFNVALIVRLKKEPATASSDDIEGLEAISTMMINSFYFQMESEGASIDRSLLLTAENGEVISVKELFRRKGSPLLIMRYSYIDCTPCIDYQVEYLRQMADSVGQNHVVILATYQSPRDLSIFKRINNITFPVYSIPAGSTGIPAEDYGSPYIFISDESLQVRCFHIPLKEIPALTQVFRFQVPQIFRRISGE